MLIVDTNIEVPCKLATNLHGNSPVYVYIGIMESERRRNCADAHANTTVSVVNGEPLRSSIMRPS